VKLAVFGDVHGNLPAFEVMLEHTQEVDAYLCLGDVVGYGPWSNECIDRIVELPGLVFIRGNHEDDYLAGRYPGSHPVAAAFFEYCHPQFDRYDAIRNLPEEHVLNGVVFRHTIMGRTIYPDSAVEIDRDHVIGHSHHQFNRRIGPHRLLNAGSVGQNRAQINVVNWLTYDLKADSFELHAEVYDVDVLVDEMVARGYPQPCVDYYRAKPRAG
jgi:predicted phosphodiesterase